MGQTPATPRRRVLLVLLDDGIEFAMWIEGSADEGTAKLLDGTIEYLNTQNEDDPASRIGCAATDCDLYDWSFRPLPGDLSVAQVPEPGVLVAVRKGRDAEYFRDGELNTVLMERVVKAALTRDDTYGPRLQRFLAGPDSLWEPEPIARFDAFVSYSTRDGVLAQDVVKDLRRRGLRCFLASSGLAAGRLWADELRHALACSRAGVILVTPQSVASNWVLAEVGALWVHAKPVVPLLAEVGEEDVPAPLRPHLANAVDVSDRDALAASLEALRS